MGYRYPRRRLCAIISYLWYYPWYVKRDKRHTNLKLAESYLTEESKVHASLCIYFSSFLNKNKNFFANTAYYEVFKEYHYETGSSVYVISISVISFMIVDLQNNK
ncbi:hypothetical protein BpHYR1_006625 [Brachionus plicatilis]|uniref:Uncharacterized protein n=1 Tax=Brachionus plicatilis TaxID=10195 RepID=A0A3M7PL34_BRAPC|nr:hypothetical protein BpHYR1_006625 [Brachionus plicatilis]